MTKKVLTGARRASGLIAAVVAMLAGLLALAPASQAAGTPAAHPQDAVVTTVAPLTRTAGWSAGPVHPGTGYQRHDGSRRVREVQRRLRRLGYAPGPVDGRFGPRTEAATLRFQARQGLRADGVVGARTLTALRHESASRRAVADWSAGPVARGTGYASATGSSRVREVQWDLRRLGYATGPVDGLFGPRTAVAVQRFQADHGLATAGAVGLATLRALRSRVPHAGAPTTTTTRPTTEPPAARTAPRPAPRHPVPATSPARPQPPDLTVFVIAALVLLGATTVAVTYGRTTRRIRAAQREAAVRAARSRAALPPGRAAGGPLTHAARTRPTEPALAREGEEDR